MSGFVDAEFFAQVEPEWSHYLGNDGERVLRGAKVVTVTQKRPARPRRDVVLVRLTIRVPRAAFMPLRPEAIVVIPDDMTETLPVQVEASSPQDES